MGDVSFDDFIQHHNFFLDWSLSDHFFGPPCPRSQASSTKPSQQFAHHERPLASPAFAPNLKSQISIRQPLLTTPPLTTHSSKQKARVRAQPSRSQPRPAEPRSKAGSADTCRPAIQFLPRSIGPAWIPTHFAGILRLHMHA